MNNKCSKRKYKRKSSQNLFGNGFMDMTPKRGNSNTYKLNYIEIKSFLK